MGLVINTNLKKHGINTTFDLNIDYSDDKKVTVKSGEQRIVQPSDLCKKKVLAPPIPEHVYERNLEKKVKQMLEEKEKSKENNK